MNTTLQKRSMLIAGKRTSLALEADFWDALEKIARANSTTLPKLVALVGAASQDASLASAVRVFALRDAQNQIAAMRQAERRA